MPRLAPGKETWPPTAGRRTPPAGEDPLARKKRKAAGAAIAVFEQQIQAKIRSQTPPEGDKVRIVVQPRYTLLRAAARRDENEIEQGLRPLIRAAEQEPSPRPPGTTRIVVGRARERAGGAEPAMRGRPQKSCDTGHVLTLSLPGLSTRSMQSLCRRWPKSP